MAIDLSNVTLDEIQHYGVKGMRWGVRKRTPKTVVSSPGPKKQELEAKPVPKYTMRGEKGAGQKARRFLIGPKIRLSKEMTPEGSRKAFVDIRPDRKRVTDFLTNEELSATIERMKLEQEYSKLSAMDMTRGEKFRQKAAQIGVDVLTDVSKGLLKDYVKGNLKGLEGLSKNATGKVAKAQAKADKNPAESKKKSDDEPDLYSPSEPRKVSNDKDYEPPSSSGRDRSRLSTVLGVPYKIDQDYLDYLNKSPEPTNPGAVADKFRKLNRK